MITARRSRMERANHLCVGVGTLLSPPTGALDGDWCRAMFLPDTAFGEHPVQIDAVELPIGGSGPAS
jgi:hypothetical protein